MSYDITTAAVVVVILALLSIGWNIYFKKYINKQKMQETEQKSIKGNGVLTKIKPVLLPASFLMYPASLSDSDDNDQETDALNYIKPTTCLDNIMEKMKG